MFLIEKMDLKNDLETIRIKTVLNQQNFNLLAIGRNMVSGQSSLREFPIANVRFSEKDDPKSHVLRLIMDEKRFFCFRSNATYRDPELIGAIFQPEVKKLDCFN